MEVRARDRACGFRRPRFDRADVACGALAPGFGARPSPDRRHGRSWFARGVGARGERRQTPGTGPRPAASHDALDRPQTEIRIAGRGAGGAIPSAGEGRAGPRRHAYSYRAYPRRSGRDAADADVARQRHRRSGGDGPRSPERDGVVLARPFLHVSKSRLVATLKKAKIGFADDPTNRDTNFTRPRLRALMPALAAEGGDARNLARLASRLARANAAVEVLADGAERYLALEGSRRVARAGSTARSSTSRLLPRSPRKSGFGSCMRAIDRFGHEGPAELGKVEALLAALDRAGAEKAEGAPAEAETDPGRRLDQPGRRPNPRSNRRPPAPPPVKSAHGFRTRGIGALLVAKSRPKP